MKNANSIRSNEAKWQRANGIGILYGLAVAFPSWSKALVYSWATISYLGFVESNLFPILIPARYPATVIFACFIILFQTIAT